MRLQHLRLENYRGFNQPVDIPLDSRVLLFYGQNGRGKSSVFGALEMALYPEEKIGDLGREYGSGEVPLTNRFNSSPVGLIKLQIEDGGEAVVSQPVRDQLAEMVPDALPLHHRLSGHRRRIFFTQELLRDLMLGSPTLRYQRLSEMLGCDAYDRLINALRQWADGRGLAVRNQLDMLKRSDELRADIDAAMKELELTGLLPELLERQSKPDVERWFMEALLQRWQEAVPDLAAFLMERAKPRSQAPRLKEAVHVLSQMRTSLRLLSEKGISSAREDIERIPVRGWQTKLQEILEEHEQARAHLYSQLTALGGSSAKMEAKRVRRLVTRFSRHRASQHVLATEHAWEEALSSIERQLRLAFSQAEVAQYVLPRIAYLREKAQELSGGMGATAGALKPLVARRNTLLHGVRHLYDALIHLNHAELVQRTQALEPLWKQYYGQISAHAHFQDVRLEVLQRLEDEDPLTAFWAAPNVGRTVRFLVSDPEARKKTEGGLPMQALLSEGQLNCAVVALALALSETEAPPLKLIALDDPFVSWDDVNMENFLTAVRDLVWKNWTVMLSTCDERVVSSFRKNMETLGIDFPAMTYTFRDWEKERGPQVDPARLPMRETKSLKDLDPAVCAFELLPLTESNPNHRAKVQIDAGADSGGYEADVWIVPLSDEPLQPGHRLKFKDIPFKLQRYYYPTAWPRRLHTKYIGFRFGGRLQATARIVSTRTVPNFEGEIPDLTTAWAAEPHMVVDLADLERWPRILRSGPMRDRHAYCDLDLLQTCETVMEADRLSAERRRQKKA